MCMPYRVSEFWWIGANIKATATPCYNTKPGFSTHYLQFGI